MRTNSSRWRIQVLCPTCDQEVGVGSAVVVAAAIGGDRDYIWKEFEDRDEDTVVGIYPGLGQLWLRFKRVDYDESQGDDERPAFMVFEINGKFYKKEGEADSYGEVSWRGGKFSEVQPKTKTIQTWE
jgi:hypothetical protein